MSVTVTVNGKSGPSVVATTGDTISAAVTKSAVVSVAASTAAAPGGTGPTGPQGPPSTTITVGSVSTLAAGSSATVVGTSSNNGANLSLAFGIPAGASGATGATGTTPTITVSATTLAAGSSATVTATPSDGGSKVALAFGLPRGADGVDGAGGGASLSNTTPSALGTASAGTSTTASRSDHVHAVPVISTTDIDGLTDALASVNVDVIDGGDYVGVVVEPTPTITITAQPASRSVSTSQSNELASTLPSGSWGAISRVNSQWITSGYNVTQADYLAFSTDGSSWTKRYGLPSAGNWSAVQYQNGVYATQAGNVVAYSSDATTWSSATFTNSRGSIFGAGGKFIRATQTGLFTSTDAATWTQTATNASTSNSISFAYENNTYFSVEQNQGIRASADGSTWAYISNSSSTRSVTSAVTFASGVHISDRSTWPIRYAGGTIANGAGSFGSTGGQFATNGSVLVFFAHTGKVYSSTNGTSFTERTLPTTLTTNGEIARLFYSGGTFALVMQYGLSGGATTTDPGTVYFTSTNGMDWTQNTRTYPTYVTTGGSYVANGYLASHNGSAWNYIQIGASTAVASFTVSAFFSGNTITYQWQVSTDGGSTFANVSGATTPTLSLSGLTAADNGKRYRCVLSATGASSVTTNSATLTVT